MKNPSYLALATILCCLLCTNSSFGQEAPANKTLLKLQELYNRTTKHEISFDEFVRLNRHVYRSSVKPAVNQPGITNLTIPGSCSKTHSFCSNGDFESGNIDMAQWWGAYGVFSGTPDPATMTDGFLSGDISNSAAHQTVVSTGTDPNTGISLIPPDGGKFSLRLGNSAIANGTELIGKTIKVDNATSILSFWYAVVFEDPNHQPADQPAFTVRVFDCATGQELNGVCNLGNNSNKLISDTKNPFFRSAGTTGNLIAYRDWTKAEIFLTSYIGKTVTILFINNDCNLGGHYGYTYLDNFCTSNVFIREPTEKLKGKDGVVNDKDLLGDLLSNTSQNRYGASADGVTKLLIIKRSEKTMKLSIPSDKDGTFSALDDQSKKSTALEAAPFKNSKGESFAIAIYNAPESYGTASALNKDGRTTKITVADKDDPTTSQDLKLNIFTPPVVMVHGLWSSADVWKKEGFYDYLAKSNFPNIELVNYTNYLSWLPAPPAKEADGVINLNASIKKGIKNYESKSIAATQVDIVSHSMGGLMARSYMKSTLNEDATNFFQGTVHKLITLGTPHYGSPLANILWNRRNEKILFTTVQEAFQKQGKTISTGVRDLGENSDGFKYLDETKAKCYAIIGNYKPGEVKAYNDFNSTVKLINDAKDTRTLDQIFQEDHDLIVGVTSQLGGIANANSHTYQSTIHTQIKNTIPSTTETNSGDIRSQVKDLLLSDKAADFAASFPKPKVANMKNEVQKPSSIQRDGAATANPSSGKQSALTQNDNIRIISPQRDTVILSNTKDQISLEYVAQGAAVPTQGVFLVEDIGIFGVPDNPPFKVSFPLAYDIPLGRINVVALARDTSGAVLIDTSSFIIRPVGTLIDFAVTPDEIEFDSLYNRQQLSVTGRLVNGSDTAFVNISDGSEIGTAYSTLKGNTIIQVDRKGLVTALNFGTDSVFVAYGSNSIIVPVTVTSVCSVKKPLITVSGNRLTSSSTSGNQWFLNDVPIEGATESTYTATERGVYTVQATAGCSSPMSDTVQLNSVSCSLSSLQLDRLKTVNLFYADAACTTLSVMGLDSMAAGSYSVKWSTGDTAAAIKVCPDTTSVYTVAVTSGDCTFTGTVTVQVVRCPGNIVVTAPACTNKVTISWTEPRDTFPASFTAPVALDPSAGSFTYMGAYNGHGYYRSNNAYLWPVARDVAAYVGGTGVKGHLATITSASENNFIFNWVHSEHISPWIGLFNTGKVGKFRWVGGEDLSYTHWALPDEPNNRGGSNGNIAEPYVQIYDDGTWNDAPNINLPFIAEFEKPLIRYKKINGPKNGSSQKPGVYTICYERTNLITDVKDTCCFTVTVGCNPSLAQEAISSYGNKALESTAAESANGAGLQVRIRPNPSSAEFRIDISSGRDEKIGLLVFDAVGRVVDRKEGLTPQQTIRLGNNFKPGVYFVEVRQGTKKVMMKMIKQSR